MSMFTSPQLEKLHIGVSTEVVMCIVSTSRRLTMQLFSPGQGRRRFLNQHEARDPLRHRHVLR
jgi:hypothetical protein